MRTWSALSGRARKVLTEAVGGHCSKLRGYIWYVGQGVMGLDGDGKSDTSRRSTQQRCGVEERHWNLLSLTGGCYSSQGGGGEIGKALRL
jgi:hypothetical protein